MTTTHALARRSCLICNEVHQVACTPEDLARYLAGDLIQVAFPEMLPEDRDTLITGLCRQAQDLLEV